MEDFLGNVGSPGLLMLMAIPITGAIIFAAIIVVLLLRRRKKSKMKLGTSPGPPWIQPAAWIQAFYLNLSSPLTRRLNQGPIFYLMNSQSPLLRPRPI